jgi:hypothetical protein
MASRSRSFSACSARYKKFPDPQAGSSTRTARSLARKALKTAWGFRSGGVRAVMRRPSPSRACTRCLVASKSRRSGAMSTGSTTRMIDARSV